MLYFFIVLFTFQLVEERRSVLKEISENSSMSETHIITDQNGKQFTFRKRKGKAMDFLDVLIQTRVSMKRIDTMKYQL